MLGPSGSGKTTTLRMIAGFELPTERPRLLHGKDVTEPAAVRARRQHRLPGLRPVPAHDRRRQRRLRPDDPQGRHARSESNASARRCAMVRLTATRSASPASSPAASANASRSPAPSSIGRACCSSTSRSARSTCKLREEMQIELKAIQQEVGITFIYVTHDQEEALTMSDRLAVFNRGRSSRSARPTRRVRATRHARSWPGFVGTSNLLSRRCGEERRRRGRHCSRVRPEKIRAAPSDDAPAADDESAHLAPSATSSTSVRTRATSSRSTPGRTARRSPSRTCTHRPWRCWPRRGDLLRLIWKRQHSGPRGSVGEVADRRQSRHSDSEWGRRRSCDSTLLGSDRQHQLIVSACGGTGATNPPT